ncbi:MAG: arginine--tRNA ligase [Pseudobdellovibrionaceae bacterium]
MNATQYNLFDSLKKTIAVFLQSLPLEDSVHSIYNSLVIPPDLQMGDYALACFLWAKSMKKNPAQVSSDWAKILQEKADPLVFSSIQAAGPYINFKFTTAALVQHTLVPVLQGTYFRQVQAVQAPRTMIEYSQPNTHKELHVGHMRNLCLGDSLVRLLRYLNYPVLTATFPGDVGTHVAKCLWYMKFHNQEPAPEKNKGEWLGRMYSKAHLRLEDEAGTPQELESKKQMTAILKQLHDQKGEYFDLWKETRQWSIEQMQTVYDWAGVTFDQWYWESDVDADSVKWVQELSSQGLLQQSQGAIGYDLESEKLGFCLLLKSDGTGLYATKDLELARRKFKDHHIEKSIYVVDMRQALHFKQVFKVLEKLGFEQAKNCYHLQYNYVELPDGAMSSRKGNIVPLQLLIEKMRDHVTETYLQRYADEWSHQDIQTVADQVTKGAIRYGMLRMDTNKKIIFNLVEWLKLDGESGPFIQYSCARILSLYRKLGVESELRSSSESPADSAAQIFTELAEKDFSSFLAGDLLQHSSERALLQTLLNFNAIVVVAGEQYKPAALCTYLYELAKLFNVFYHDCSIGQAESLKLKQARLALSLSVGRTLMEGLSLLGIPVPNRM